MLSTQEIIEKIYSLSGLNQCINLIIDSYSSFSFPGLSYDNERKDILQVLELIDIDKINSTEMIALLICTIEYQNPEAYKSNTRKEFYLKVEKHLVEVQGIDETKNDLQGLE